MVEKIGIPGNRDTYYRGRERVMRYRL
jgi:hypothetical protein